MFRFRTLVLVPLVIVAMSRVAIAAPILFTATMNGAQENNPSNYVEQQPGLPPSS